MIRFGEILPRIRARVERDLALPGMPREKVLATVVRLLESTLQRIGSDEYARTNDSYGLTTLRNRHVDVEGSTVRLQFRGKGGKLISLGVSDARVARVVRRCQELPGCDLFCYIDDDGQIRDVDSGDVNEYLKEISGEDFTAKDFRTWAGTLLAARALSVLDGRTKVALKRNVVAAVKHVAERLGNTPAVCRTHYVHPAVLNMYAAGGLAAMFGERGQKAAREDDKGMRAEELCLLRLLREAEAADGAPKTSSRPTRRKTKIGTNPNFQK
jgi:DNA topoisomerase-1